MKHLWLFLMLGLCPFARADLSNGTMYLFDALGNPILSTSNALNTFITNGTLAVTQSGTWSTGRTWTLSSGTDSVASIQSGTWNVGLSAGSNLVGKVSIDQTTPGTTNAVQANAGTNLNTSLLATSANLTAGTSKTQIVDGSGNVQPSGDVLTRKIFVQPTDGSNSQGYTAGSEAKVSVTQPLPTGTNVIGALTANQSVNVAQVNGVTTSVNTGVSGTGTQRVTLAADGQKTMANSTAVTIASDQTGLNSFLDKSGTGTISALNGAVTFTANGMSTATISAQGTFTATLQVQCQAGDNAWTAVIGYVPGTGNTATVLTGASMLVFPIGGCNQVRIIAIAYTSGTANIQYNLGNGVQGVQVFNLTAASLQATDNVSQFGGVNVSTGTGASGTGIPRVTVANDSKAQIWDGTNTQVVKAASTTPAFTDTATAVTQRPDAQGTVTETSVSCATSSTTLLAASTATMFISVRNPTTATATVWIQFNGSAATAAAPSVDLAPGSEADFFAHGPSWLPTSQFNCISGGASASTVTLYYK